MQEICGEKGIQIKTAMIADINGISMGQRDALIENGVEFLYTNIHTHPAGRSIGCYQNQNSLFSEMTDVLLMIAEAENEVNTKPTKAATMPSNEVRKRHIEV